ncbi:hypothetical protein ACFQRB_08080 [Halobaculum litoreum]|uniref:Uncharacterized protein n=1 Tax=Halobaculum litoreum TaxID=3031998 RepID=A0ABD5XN67_9EURY
MFRTVDGDRAASRPVLVGSWVVAAGYDAISTTRSFDGHRGWTVNGRFDRCAPVAAGDTLYVGDPDGVHAFALSGGVGVGGTGSAPSGGRSRSGRSAGSPSAPARSWRLSRGTTATRWSPSTRSTAGRRTETD